MKKTTKKLALNKLTVRDLASVAGGRYPTQNTCFGSYEGCSESCNSCQPLAYCQSMTLCTSAGC